ncbi:MULTISPECIES: glycosyltransferase [unclassified Microbacterium]|uniref:glycosyltransferase n=1 Tax=unclassified Microbacterium TaxID=2609290 RepID=UPI00068E6AE6|nr:MULTISPECIES: glycosyltransferase [unclassified Microbacterium]MCV0333167.1 glycosyltransferase family 2 protein [Microbacterium sp.]MCV0375612.1 glycosyltransferase family 2 protein [Microbacterium sp.]MCV0389033.1 glycosyltransferase family 2 protein [Microbacterium sp.]MCV0417561.1 glycosyltransferase family 2 protein [Microbacterium sp.]MCV0420872.1 glycosyltransferase family 2 protein [Microbacterium sp.]
MTLAGDTSVSVVIPSYNSARWLPSTLDALAVAVRQADAGVEVIVVDDGSDDGSGGVVERLAADFPGDLVVVRQENSGRFLARWAGIERARGEHILLLDSRVIIAPGALSYLLSAVAADPKPAGWNAHVHTDPASPLVGRFWEVPTFVFWGRYLRDPRPYDLTPATFDSAPKGTGAFLARKEVLVAAFTQAWPEGDAKLISDDTKILRWIAQNGGIRLDPGFSATYRPRTTVGGFVRHSFDRGTLFVDSYAGTSAVRSIVLLLAAIGPILAIAAIVWLAVAGSGVVALALVAVLVLLLLAPLIPAAINRCPPQALLSYVTYILVFLVPFWSGLLRGIVVHRGAFLDRSRSQGPVAGKAHQ